MIDYKNSVVELITEKVELDKKEICELIEIPPEIEMGDYAFPCFILAKTFKKNPALISKELAEEINLDSKFEKVVSNGPYLNFYLNRTAFKKDILTEAFNNTNYGKKNI